MIVAQNRVRIGFMDMDRVLENLNDYKDANAALEDKITFEMGRRERHSITLSTNVSYDQMIRIIICPWKSYSILT